MGVFIATAVALIVCAAVAYVVGWRIVGRKLTGQKRHLVRGAFFAVLVGPFLMFRLHDVTRLHRFIEREPPAIVDYLLIGLPGLFLAGGLAYFLSEIYSGGARRSGLGDRLPRAVLAAALMWSLNWYVAGIPRLRGLHYDYDHGLTDYMLSSRPGTVDLMNGSMQTPLGATATRSEPNLELAAQLIEHGADVNALVAAPWGRTIGEMPDTTILHWVAGEEDTAIALLLINHGAALESRDLAGLTPLHFAVRRGRLQMARLLLASGADVNARTREVPDDRPEGLYSCDPEPEAARTPLHFTANDSCWEGESREPISCPAEICRVLVDAGAEVGARDIQKRTPLFLAARRGNHLIVDCLLKGGAKASSLTAEQLGFLKRIVTGEKDAGGRLPSVGCGPGAVLRNKEGVRQALVLLGV